MPISPSGFWRITLLACVCAAGMVADRLPMISFAEAESPKRISASSSEVRFTRLDKEPGTPLEVTVAPGQDQYPGITIVPPSDAWDLSHFNHVEVRLTNPGSRTITIVMRVDNDGDWSLSPNNADKVEVNPGSTAVLPVYFGWAWGNKGYALDPSKVVRVLLFAGKVDGEQRFRVETLEGAGKQGEPPPPPDRLLRTVPADGIVFGKGVSAAAFQLTGKQGEIASSTQGLKLAAESGACAVVVRPPKGCWDLRAHAQVTVRLRNTGTAPVVVRARLESDGGGGEWIAAAAPLAPGASAAVEVPFSAGSVWTGASNGSGPHFDNAAASGVAIQLDGDGKRSVLVEGIRAGALTRKPPDWLGKRPPVDGAWTQTFAEEFDGTTLDPKRWDSSGDNGWDSVSAFAKENVLIGGGVAKLRFEKRKTKADREYTTGFLTSTHLWTQRYGYFEARMKLPKAPGLWPAFWMMPDRGPVPAGLPDWRRWATDPDGMEFDIMEFLTRYGPNHYNIAVHWDGYGANHKSVGTEHGYVQPDPDGFIVSGMLWEPGKASFYGNGQLLAVWADPSVSKVSEHFIFTHVAGGWGGNDLTGAGLPDDLVIDWVRAWQRDGLARAPGSNYP